MNENQELNTYNNLDIYNLLYDNLSSLTKIHYNNQFLMSEEITKLKNNNKLLEDKLLIETNKRKILEDENSKKLIIKLPKINKYLIKYYKPINISFNPNEIIDILINIKNITDIIKLKNLWNNIKHNNKLQKLYNTIPALEKLDLMIGLDNIKEYIFKIIIYYVQHDHDDEYLHSVIYGAPGVGKTELARIYSDIFVRLGILKNNSFIEIKKDDLVSKYFGQTANKTKQLLEKSMGGVIFLDEAYSLGDEEKKNFFAKEAIDIINQYLSDRKKDFMFIIAGYEDDLEKCFFFFNKGLKRRFVHYFKIEKYTFNELVLIFKNKIKKSKYILDDISVSDKELNIFFKNNYTKFENSAGDIEKFYNYIKYDQSIRIFKTNTENNIIIMNDLTNSLINLKKKVNENIFGLYI